MPVGPATGRQVEKINNVAQKRVGEQGDVVLRTQGVVGVGAYPHVQGMGCAVSSGGHLCESNNKTMAGKSLASPVAASELAVTLRNGNSPAA